MARRLFFLLALLVFFGVAGAWLATGAHTGWTKTKVSEIVVDDLTGLEYPVWKDRLVFGVDFLAGGLLGCAVIGAVGLFCRRPRAIARSASENPSDSNP